MSTYAEKLKDPRWQRKRLEIMQRDGFECCICGERTKTLNVHHRYYVSGRSPWEYPNFALATLCEECHVDAGEVVYTPGGNAYYDGWEMLLCELGSVPRNETGGPGWYEGIDAWFHDIALEVARAKERGITAHMLLDRIMMLVLNARAEAASLIEKEGA